MEQNICSRCIMDTSVKEITFNENRECQYCMIHDDLEMQYPSDSAKKQEMLHDLVQKIKEAGKGKKYDCICGVSGGRDSSWLLMKVVELGLRPLAVHFDNGWNSEIAVSNIKNLCSKLNVDLETYVVDWNEFKDLQISMLKASVPDVEVPTDVAIHSVLHKYAVEEDIKYILNGHSFRTEGVTPRSWSYIEGKYIESVHRLFGKIPLKTFPNFKMWDFFYCTFIKKIKVYPIINLLTYEHAPAMKELEEKMGWKYYGGHHHENYYTKFIQSYLLPQKFKIDKRKTELSAFVRSGKMTRDEALKEVNTPYEFDPKMIDYILPKLNLSKEEWEKIYNLPVKSFEDYPSYYSLMKLFKKPIYIATKIGLLPKLLYFKFLG